MWQAHCLKGAETETVAKCVSKSVSVATAFIKEFVELLTFTSWPVLCNQTFDLIETYSLDNIIVTDLWERTQMQNEFTSLLTSQLTKQEMAGEEVVTVQKQ